VRRGTAAAGRRSDSRIYLVVSGLAVAGALALRLMGFGGYAPYFGRLDPILVTAIAGALGWAILPSLGERVRIPPPPGERGLGRAAAIATVLAALMIAVDTRIPFPAGINAPPPAALLFYPSIGLVAEVAFHLAPLGLVLFVLDRVPALRGSSTPVVAGLVVASLVEPAFQVLPSTTGPFVPARSLYVAIHVWVLSGLQLWLFRRHGFFAMYLLRLVYYFWWHIVWGALRLALLF
jgi:hypothetical protein